VREQPAEPIDNGKPQTIPPRPSASLFSFNLVIRETDYEQSGETMVYVDKGDRRQQISNCFPL
jgi:hypothetical protein